MEFVVSDVSRPGFVSPRGDLRKVQDCGTWRVCSVDRKLEQEKARKQVTQNDELANHQSEIAGRDVEEG